MSKPSSTNRPNDLSYPDPLLVLRTCSYEPDSLVEFRFIDIGNVDYSKTFLPIWVAIAAVSHLFPFRTEKLNLPAPMVLHNVVGE